MLFGAFFLLAFDTACCLAEDPEHFWRGMCPKKEDLDKLAASAVEQMKDKKYDVNLDTPVYYIGLSHCGKQAAVYYQKS